MVFLVVTGKIKVFFTFPIFVSRVSVGWSKASVLFSLRGGSITNMLVKQHVYMQILTLFQKAIFT